MGGISAGLANYAVRLLARQQLLWQIQRCEEKTTRFGLVMRIYNPLSQQQENEIARRYAETVNTLKMVQADNHAIETIIFIADNGYSYDSRYLNKYLF